MNEGRQTLYVGCAHSGELYTAALAPDTGKLEYVAHTRLPELCKAGGAMPLATSRAGNWLYAVSRGEPFFIARFAIDRQGNLKHKGNTPIDTNLAYIQLTADDRHLLSASFIDHHVSVFDIHQDHSVASPPHRIREIPNAHTLCTAPDDRSVLATSLSKDVIYQWQWPSLQSSYNACASLKPVAELALPSGTGPRHIAHHPTRPVAYIIGERNGTISVVHYGTEGLSHAQTAYLHAQQEPFQAADIHVTADGRFVYASEKATSTLHLFNVQPDGALEFEERFATEKRPRSFAITTNGHYLVAAGQFSNHIASYRIDAESGHLDIVDRLSVGESPDWVEMR